MLFPAPSTWPNPAGPQSSGRRSRTLAGTPLKESSISKLQAVYEPRKYRPAREWMADGSFGHSTSTRREIDWTWFSDGAVGGSSLLDAATAGHTPLTKRLRPRTLCQKTGKYFTKRQSRRRDIAHLTYHPKAGRTPHRPVPGHHPRVCRTPDGRT